jgi:hypothetical protein
MKIIKNISAQGVGPARYADRAWVEPVLRDCAREAARLSGLEFSRWVERAVQPSEAK